MPNFGETDVNAQGIFTKLLTSDNEKSTGLAAIETLMEVLKTSDGKDFHTDFIYQHRLCMCLSFFSQYSIRINSQT